MSRWDQTHEQLQRAALELFAEHGYAATGTLQIARSAAVSEMTLFRHFPTKESLLLADPFDPVLAQAVRARPDHEPAMSALARGIRQAWTQLDAEAVRQLRTRLRIVAETPGLEGAIQRSSGSTIAKLAEALEARGVAPVDARSAATAVIAGVSVALVEWAGSDEGSLDDALGSALAVLGGE